MRICLLMGGAEAGGLETHFAELANGLAALGETVTAIGHPRYEADVGSGVAYWPLDLSRSRRNPLLRRKLRQLLQNAAADIVHAQGGKAAHLLADLAPPARLVGTVHNVKRNLAAYADFDAVIGVSHGVLASLEHPRKVVIHNGVQPPPPPVSAACLRQRFDIPAERAVTLAVGRLVPAKGLPALVRLWQPAFGQLLILGDGPQRPVLEQLAEGKPVTLAGHQADARRLMGGADLMVFASEREGFSYAMAEALRARLPVVSTPVPGAAEALPAEQLAAPAQLGQVIGNCLADLPATRQRMAPVFDWAERTLTVERMVAATRDVYRQLVP